MREDWAFKEQHGQGGTTVPATGQKITIRVYQTGTIRRDEQKIKFQLYSPQAPPVEKVLAGRANVEGQRVRYCSEQEKTAIAEVRPPLGYYVSVGEVILEQDARILDLAKETDDINPFVTEPLPWHVQIRSLLGAFAEGMSRPLERDDDKTHYLPCQNLAEFIRENRYDGIRYPSAVCPGGSDVVLFDPDIADVTGARLARITEWALEYEVEETAAHETHAGESTEMAGPEEGSSS